MRKKRKFLGVELKSSYFATAARALESADNNASELFDTAAAE